MTLIVMLIGAAWWLVHQPELSMSTNTHLGDQSPEHDTERRRALQTAAALAVASSLPASAAATDEPSPSAAMRRALPPQRTPGRPGDFDFLNGHWKIQHQRRKEDSWDRFEGEARCDGLLGGVCSVEELLIPARGFSGMGLRLLDVKARRWSDFWVNAASGALTTPGLSGSFEDGAGIFESEDTDERGVRVLYRSVWDQITRDACRWQQGSSRDGGQSWAVDWSMAWRRVV